MRTASKLVLIIVLILLVYSIAKLISAATTKNNAVRTWPMKQSQNIPAKSLPETPAVNEVQNLPPTPDTPNAQGLYQADEILIDGQGKVGQNYIDITSDTPITPQAQNNNTQSNNNGGGAYAQASVTIDHNTNTSTSAQTYAPGMPAFEVIDGN